jgi:hypothetical protein
MVCLSLRPKRETDSHCLAPWDLPTSFAKARVDRYTHLRNLHISSQTPAIYREKLFYRQLQFIIHVELQIIIVHVIDTTSPITTSTGWS